MYRASVQTVFFCTWYSTLLKLPHVPARGWAAMLIGHTHVAYLHVRHATDLRRTTTRPRVWRLHVYGAHSGVANGIRKLDSSTIIYISFLSDFPNDCIQA